jgi:hypothetical protein
MILGCSRVWNDLVSSACRMALHVLASAPGFSSVAPSSLGSWPSSAGGLRPALTQLRATPKKTNAGSREGNDVGVCGDRLDRLSADFDVISVILLRKRLSPNTSSNTMEA